MKNKLAYKNLSVWDESLELVKYTYILTSVFPEDEKEGIIRAIKDHAVKIPGGIAKAMQTEKNDERKSCFNISLNAIIEIETLLLIAQKLDYISENDVKKYTDKSSIVSMQISGIMQKFGK
jgi:four helix bundle protein